MSEIEHERELLDGAHCSGLRIYTVSTGRNWGYGASAPVVDGCVVMNLSNMDRIHRIDERRGLVEIGPGVTQGQLCQALRGSALLPDATGAGHDTSVLCNVLDGGFGHTPGEIADIALR